MSSVVDFFFQQIFFSFFSGRSRKKKGETAELLTDEKSSFFLPFFFVSDSSSFPFFFFAAIPFCSFHGKWSTCGGVSVRCSTDYVGKWKQQKKTVPPKKKQSNRFLFLKKKRNVLFLIKVGLGTNRNSFLDRKTSFHHLLVFVLEDTRFYLVLPSFT